MQYTTVIQSCSLIYKISNVLVSTSYCYFEKMHMYICIRHNSSIVEYISVGGIHPHVYLEIKYNRIY